MTLARPPRILRAVSSVQPRNELRSIPMGRGDKKTAKGKRYIASYGNARPQKPAAKKSKKISKK